MGNRYFSLLTALGFLLALTASAMAQRTSEGLIALYDFTSPTADKVEDHSGLRPAVDLRIADPNKVRRSVGALEVRSPTIIRSEKGADRLNQAVRRSGAITVEAWIKPTKLNQAGPARIVSLSKDSSNRNVTLGQDGDKIDARMRTAETGNNGVPSLPTPARSLTTELTHVVYTRDRGGQARLFLGGRKVSERKVGGPTKNWDVSMGLALANEFGGGRPWVGTYYLVALYDRALTPGEIAANHSAGAGASAAPAVAKRDPSEELFETKVAAILANHCVECHDSVTRKGKLDLSHRSSAFAGGSEGSPITPGDSGNSLLWETVSSDEMPEDRPPLSDEEKAALREWIDSGAKWTIDFIDPADFEHKTQVAQNFVRRLTLPEYIDTVRAATGVDIGAEARELLPPDLRADGFSNTAYNLNVALKHVDAYSQLAGTIAGRMDIPAFAKRFSKNRSLTDRPMREHIERMGKWMLRGPLRGNELDAFRGISTTVASAGGGFDEAVRYIVEAMLQSPRFIYHMEDQRSSQPDEYELASRISYILWGGPPDQSLIAAAERGELFSAEALETQLARMLDDPRAVERSLQFASDWLNLGRLRHLTPNTQRFPDWKPELAADMREETLAYFREVVWGQDRPLGELFNTQLTFATPALAQHYDLQPISTGGGIGRYDLSGVPARGGLLTQGSILTIGGDDASMVTRGLFVLHDVLRGTVKDPPPGTDTTPVPSKPGVTQRKVATDRIKSKACGGCHAKFEPLAFGLERFDGTGAFSERDQFGNTLREDGVVPIPGEPQAASYENAAELMDLLAKSDRVAQTITRKVTQFALGRPLTPDDRSEIEKIHSTAQDHGGTYRSLIRAIIASDLVQKNPSTHPS